VTAPLLAIEDLKVTFSTRNGLVEALKGVSLTLDAGETLGIVGESGSGKSVTAFSVMRLLDRAGRITNGRIAFRGEDITGASRAILQPLRGAAMSMIFQNPRAALNPIRTVGLQIADVLRAHQPLSAAEARDKALHLLESVLIHDPVARLDAYPHELSGGMCQRVMIAMAIACEPTLLIADEPTTGLDVTTQKTVMDLLAEITSRRGMAMILITHDLGLAAQYCKRVAVMEQGLVVEEAPPATLFGAPLHTYTKRLVAASPTRTSTVDSLVVDAVDRPAAPARIASRRAAAPLLEVSNLVKTFTNDFRAVDDVSFSLAQGESLGLVGESGSGKSTISRLVCRLLDHSAGTIAFDGEDIGRVASRDFYRSRFRKDIQIVFRASPPSTASPTR
jgi:peptide/nickel transport system ATP-binding protein